MTGAISYHLRAFSFVAFILVSWGVAEAQTRVNSITIEGNARIPNSSIISFSGLTPGEVASDGQLNDAVQGIMASGLFETAEIIPTGNGIRIAVVERPTISRISIEGNKRLDDEALLGALQSSPRRVYSPATAAADAATIADAYSATARLAANVTPRIIRRSDNRVDLVFEVSEGRVVENERISFVGNRAYSDRRLRRVIQTKQAGFLRAIIGGDTLVPERINFDRQLLVDFYRARGYVDFQVLDVATELSRERDATFVTFNVREGQSYSVGAVSVTSEFANIDLQDYRDALRIRSGNTWSPTLIEEQVARLERKALRDGLDFLRVDPRITRNRRDLTLDVEFALVRGPRVFVERIDIEGNQTTLDRVIRRQFDTVEGDPFNPREIRNAAERVRALGYFGQADVQTRQGTAGDQVIVDVDVEEQPTGSLSFGGSFSEDNGFALLINFSERNFLGRGQRVSVNVETGAENSRTTFSFTEPSFLARDLAFGIDLGYVTQAFDDASYDTKVASISPSLAFPTGENSRLSVYYELSENEILNVEAGSSPIIQAEAGTELRSAVGYRYTLDMLRGGLNPNRGVRLTFGQELAGLGGDSEYLKTTASAVAQRDVWNEEVTVRAIFEAGALTSLNDTNSRVTDRFFLSSRQLRGFESRGVGPRDTGAANSDVLGGNAFVSLRFEADFPLPLPSEYGISGGLFYDMASLWDLDNTAGAAVVDDGFELRSSIGVSLLWDTPIGPLRMNFAKPIKENALDRTNSFDVTISTQF
ncbi:MAG: outer membrane protein assembly factor BamA [Silicimonas sp.]|nr:outer membrane protein assembly factor BamA [Silicimonas sp.]